MQLIDGKKTAEEIRHELAKEVENMKMQGEKVPHLAAVLLGNDGASETYVANKAKACEQVGFRSTVLKFDASITEGFLLDQVKSLNNNSDIDGFIVQLPLPAHISEQKVIEAIDPRKDVDGFHPVNIGRTLLGMPSFVSATPYGIIELIKRYNIETQGKHCVVIGRSNIVGRPVSVLMSLKNYPGDATVTVCHSRTRNMEEITRQADILIAAIGIPGFVKGNMVKDGVVVIDVGTTRVPSEQTKSGFKLKGDVDFDEVAPKASYITPVPGGVGPMTIVSLLKNTFLAARGEIYK
ncbi:MAG: bifunctional 5,10-methylene-tetrahydrofolate dehydrogenase/5,10-methylene-tetrahydrofolate cyclohydrolase [Bacteroidales bacterium]|nr:bifunctional 5,10-methylene-tetrahydrofolate dehydrogenase/5,10-methylene-tetrahydrofolate cyclohydrolase [Bacteroidales bacterium]